MAAAKPLSSKVPIVQPNGTPTPEFQRAWQGLSTTAGQLQPDTYVRKGQLTGWASPTSATSRLTFATYAAPAAAGAYSQAQMQALMDHVEILSQRLAAAVNDLKTSQLFTS